ncbi:MAG: hypothetical protein IJQ08_02395 [Synergistaceae bacterium]|nr:hypothetical protein [Synergistaceae bacterium]
MDGSTKVKALSDDELWAFAQEWAKNPRPVDLAEVGIYKQPSPDGLETLYDGDPDPFGLDKPGGGILKRILRFIVR